MRVILFMGFEALRCSTVVRLGSLGMAADALVEARPLIGRGCCTFLYLLVVVIVCTGIDVQVYQSLSTVWSASMVFGSFGFAAD